MLLNRLHCKIDRISKMIALPEILKFLPGLQILGIIGLISYFLFNNTLNLIGKNALLTILILGEIISLLITRWMSKYLRSELSEERQRSELALHQSEAKFRRLIEANLIGVSVADFDGALLEANDAFLKMVGYTRDDLHAGHVNWMEMTPPEYLHLDQKATEHLIEHGVFVPFEKEYWRKDGSRVPVLVGHALLDEEQHISIGFELDLTEQKRTETALRQSEAKFRRLIEANLIGVAVAYLDGEFIEANDAFLAMVGYTRTDLCAGCMNWIEMTPPEYLEIDRQATEQMRTTGTFAPFEKEYYRKDGSRVPVLLGHAVFDAEQQVSIGFVLNLTDRKRAEVASVLEERNRMAQEIHDTLAQAFTSIIVHLDVASRKLDSDRATAQACIQTSYQLAQSGLAEARRSVAALHSHYLETNDLYTALCHLARQIFLHTDTYLNFNCLGEKYPLPQEVENNLLRIGQESLMNSYKYACASEIRLDLKYEPTQFILQIKDNGKGFETERVMSVNQNADSFGLLGMKQRAERIKGKLTIQSRPEQGTNIAVTINREAFNATG